MYKMLIVDDEVLIAEGLLNLMNYNELGITTVQTATNFEDAVKIAMELKPDITLLDVCIHDRKGFEIIEYLNKFGLVTNYVMVSGYDDFSYAKEAVMHGAKNYILKPVDKSELRKTLEKIITKELGGEIPTAEEEDKDKILEKSYDSFSKLTRKVLVLIQQEYSTTISLKSIADRFGMNSTYLGQLFLKDTGMKFSEYLMLYRLMIAKEMIEATDDKIVYIAEKVGYTNANYFYTQFQQRYKMSPLDFRRG